MWIQSDPRGKGKFNKLKVRCSKCHKFGHFVKECKSKIDHAHVSQEKSEESLMGEIKDYNLSVTSEECAMNARTKKIWTMRKIVQYFWLITFESQSRHYKSLMEQE